MEDDKLRAGIHPSVIGIIEAEFDEQEKIIVHFWRRDWFITYAGTRITAGRSTFKFFLAKPLPHIEQALNLSREVIVILSAYNVFEPRTLEAFKTIRHELQEQRYEKICYALISADSNIDQKLKDCLTNQEDQIIIPFYYSNFEQNKDDSTYILNKFQKYFYSRDLFDYSEPLKNDTFFFGRTNIVTTVIQKHRTGSNYGLFGLRKTGKTSIIYDIVRKSSAQDYLTFFIDCQDTSFNLRRWNKALYYIAEKIATYIGKKLDEDKFTEEDAGQLFDKVIQDCYNKTRKTILLLFDEIENITFQKSASKHWREELDFVYFWQSIRSAYQNPNSKFTFTIFGTNPKCIEESIIQKADNPIYSFFQPDYIPGFNHNQTREMVRRLSRIMGLKFEEEIYTHLMEDYGGHPFLIRRVCSKIAKLNEIRPVTIDRIKYQEAKRQFNKDNVYFEMILDVLKQFYPDEFEMLTFLAMDDNKTFNFYVTQDPSIVRHLVGYGLIKENDNHFDFCIDAIKEYLLRKNNDHPILTSPEKKWAHICTLRNEIEIELRKMVRSIIKIANTNETNAKNYVLGKVFGNNPKYIKKSYQELFDSRISEIYLKNLQDLINANWQYFSDYFDNQEIFIAHMNILKKEGRFDAHGTVPSDDEINAIDNAAKYINKCIKKYKASNE